MYMMSPHLFPDRSRLESINETKVNLEKAKHELDVAQRKGDFEAASRLQYSTIPALEAQLPKESDETTSLIHDRVTSGDIARVVARATGIPVQSLLKGEKEKLVHVGVSLTIV